MLTDRIRPIRVAILVTAIYLPLYAVQISYLFFNPSSNTVLAIALAHTAILLPVAALWNAAEFPLMIRLLPRQRYGPF